MSKSKYQFNVKAQNPKLWLLLRSYWGKDKAKFVSFLPEPPGTFSLRRISTSNHTQPMHCFLWFFLANDYFMHEILFGLCSIGLHIICTHTVVTRTIWLIKGRFTRVRGRVLLNSIMFSSNFALLSPKSYLFLPFGFWIWFDIYALKF